MAEDQGMWQMNHMKFDSLWNQFQNGSTPPIYNPEQAAGCNGRKNTVTLSVHLDAPEIIEKVQTITDSICQIPGVYIMPTESYHITVKWLGFLTDKKQHDYDLGPRMLDPILEQANQILSGIPSFSVRLGSVNGLESFIILEVEDNGAIAHIQERFHQEAVSIPSYSLEGEKWLPHLSIAAIRTLDGLAQLKTSLKKFRHIEVGNVTVSHVDLLQATLQKPCPQYRILQSFPLAYGSGSETLGENAPSFTMDTGRHL